MTSRIEGGAPYKRGLAPALGIAAAAVLALAGCVLGPEPRYLAGGYPGDAAPIAALASIEGISVGVGEFSRADQARVRLGCAEGSVVELAGGTAVEQYQRAALVAELRRAGLYERTDHAEAWKNAEIVLSGELHRLELDRDAALWVTGLEIASTRGERMSITDAYRIERGDSAAGFCANAARALAPAVRRVFKTMADSSHFQRYLVPAW